MSLFVATFLWRDPNEEKTVTYFERRPVVVLSSIIPSTLVSEIIFGDRPKFRTVVVKFRRLETDGVKEIDILSLLFFCCYLIIPFLAISSLIVLITYSL